MRRSTPDKVVPEINKYGGAVLQTSLSNDGEAKLQAALSQGAATATSDTSTTGASANSKALPD